MQDGRERYSVCVWCYFASTKYWEAPPWERLSPKCHWPLALHQQIIERHLHEKGFSQSPIKQYAHDKFGAIMRESTPLMLLNLMFMLVNWKTSGTKDYLPSRLSTPQFFDWFLAQTSKNVLCEHWEKIAMGSPPKPFYTNLTKCSNQREGGLGGFPEWSRFV